MHTKRKIPYLGEHEKRADIAFNVLGSSGFNGPTPFSCQIRKQNQL